MPFGSRHSGSVPGFGGRRPTLQQLADDGGARRVALRTPLDADFVHQTAWEPVRREVLAQVLERDRLFRDQALRAPVVVLDVGGHVVEARPVANLRRCRPAPTPPPWRRTRPRPGPCTCVCYLTNSREAVKFSRAARGRGSRGDGKVAARAHGGCGRSQHIRCRLRPGAAGPAGPRGGRPRDAGPESGLVLHHQRGQGRRRQLRRSGRRRRLLRPDGAGGEPASPARADLARVSERRRGQRPAVGERARSHRRRARGTTPGAR